MTTAHTAGRRLANQLPVTLTVNGITYERMVEPRTHLADFLREHLELTGTHIGCEQGVCGACTILVDGEPVRSCLMLALQADGMSVTTIEGLAADGETHPVQDAFREAISFQCGFCTPGFVMTAVALLDREDPTAELDAETIREEMAGNLCRCTGYQSIVEGVQLAAEKISARSADNPGRP